MRRWDAAPLERSQFSNSIVSDKNYNRPVVPAPAAAPVGPAMGAASLEAGQPLPLPGPRSGAGSRERRPGAACLGGRREEAGGVCRSPGHPCCLGGPSPAGHTALLPPSAMAQRQPATAQGPDEAAGSELTAGCGPVQIRVAVQAAAEEEEEDDEDDEEEEGSGAPCPAARGGGSCSEEDAGRCWRSR